MSEAKRVDVRLPAEQHSTPATRNESASLVSLIERMASDQSIDLARVERMVEIRERWIAAEAKRSYLAAFARLQAILPAAARRGTGHNQKKYARFEDVMEALRPALSQHGFSINFRIRQAPNLVTIVGILGHSDGHSEETEFTLAPDTSGNKTPVHALASAVSYGKRYVTLTLTGIATDDDDDGQAASGKEPDEHISAAQIAELEALIKETKTDKTQFLAIGKIDSLADITVANFPRAKGDLLSKKAAMQKTAKASTGNANA